MKTIILFHAEEFKSAATKLMHSTRHITLVLTVITTLTIGLWASNAVAVVKNYNTDAGNTWVCGSAPVGLVGTLNDAGTYACLNDKLSLTSTNNQYIATWIMPTAYSNPTLVTGTDLTFALYAEGSTNIDMEFELGYTTDSINFTPISTANFTGTTVGSFNTIVFSEQAIAPAGSKLSLRLYNSALASQSAGIRLGSQSSSIRLSVDEEVVGLCDVPVTNLQSDVTLSLPTITTTITWNSVSIPSDLFKVYRNGDLIGTVADLNFTDSTALPNASYTYVVRNYSTVDRCEGPEAALVVRVASVNVLPTSHDFGEVVVGDTGVKTFTISNTASSEPVTVTSVMLSGNWASSYSVISDACTGAVLSPYQSCSIETTFTPNDVGIKDASLSVIFDNSISTIEIPLNGGIRPHLFKDIFPGSNSSNHEGTLFISLDTIDINGILFFIADDGTNGYELWKSDGSPAGTMMVKDIAPGNSNSSPASLTNVNGMLYFSADDGIDGNELWMSDGSPDGTMMVKDIHPTGSSRPIELTNVNGTLYFNANDGDGTNNHELWKSDGTPTGTELVKEINPTSYSFPSHLTHVNGILYFHADDGIHGFELWKSDGTPTGTELVKDINPTDLVNPSDITVVNGTMYFTADGGSNGSELWKSDGTNADTVLVKDITAGGPVDASELTDVNGTLFFTAHSGDLNYDLWKSDGSANGTVLVKNITIGSIIDPTGLTNVNGTLFFRNSVIKGFIGSELWKSDGEDANTVLVKEIQSPDNLTSINGQLYFIGQTGSGGRELWKSDGTPDGTFMVMDIFPGLESSLPRDLNLVESGGSLFFSANDGAVGAELWSLNPSGRNTPSVISPIADQDTYDNNPLEIFFSISDEESVVNCSDVVATSANSAVLDDDNILISSNPDQTCAIKLTPAMGASGIGNSVVTLTLSNGVQITATSFSVNWIDTTVVGLNASDPWVDYVSIQAAIDNAVNGDTVVVSDGDYSEINVDFNGKNITLKSANGPQKTTIDCKYSGRAFYMINSNAIIQGFTIQNCQAPSGQEGGAIFINNFSPSIIDNRFIRNFAAGGGAISSNGTPVIDGNIFYGNSSGSYNGGAIEGGFEILINNDFENNTAKYGGAVSFYRISGGTNLIDNNRFMFNRAVSGGAISSGDSSGIVVKHSSFTGNMAVDNGGAIDASVRGDTTSKPITISNSVFVDNKAGKDGGALFLESSQITNSSFYGNKAVNGGAIAIDSLSALAFGSLSSGYDVAVVNSILWGNSAEQTGNQLFYKNTSGQLLNLTIGFSVLQGGTTNIGLSINEDRATDLLLNPLDNILDIDPLFAMEGNLRLMPGSPAIDEGTNNPSGGLSVLDFDSVSRKLGGIDESTSIVDMGAFEFDPANQNKLAVNTIRFRALATINDSPPESQVLTLRNIGGGSSKWTISENIDWLYTDTGSGTATDLLQSIRLYIDHTGLEHRVHEGVVDIIDTDSGLLYRRLTVVLNVNQRLTVSVSGGGDYETIQEAVDAAIDGDTILVASGLYFRDDLDGVKRDKNIDTRGKAITIKSETGPETTIIDVNDNGTGSGFIIDRGEDRRTIIEGFTIREGDYGIKAGENVSATFINLKLLTNTNQGIFASGAISIRRCEFLNNGKSGSSGGGVFISNASGAEVIESRFSRDAPWPTDPTPNIGAGIYINASHNVRIENSEFINLISSSSGGAIYALNSNNLSILNSVFEGNRSISGNGGAIYAKNTENTNIANCLIYNNSGSKGGGIYSDEGDNFQVTNCTLSNNETLQGSTFITNIYFESISGSGNKLTLTNSILYQSGGTGADLANNIDNFVLEYELANDNITVYNSTIKSGWAGPGTGNNPVDPMLRDPAAGDFRLDPASPMIDTGLTLSTLFSDIRGSVRPIDGNTNVDEPGAQFDRGAYEYSEYYGGIAGDEVAKSLDNLRINGIQQVVGFEYVIQWDDKDPFPAGDPRISQAGEYDVNLALVSDEGLRIELDSYTVTVSLAGYNQYFTFAPEHIGDWKLRVELAEDPNQFVLSDNIFIRYKEVTEYDLGKEIIAPAAADRTQKPDVDNEAIVYWSAETNRLYAIGPGTTVVTWYEDDQRENPIPVVAQLDYPEYPQIHIADTQAVSLLPAGSPYDAVEKKYSDNDASIAGNAFTATIEGWAVLLFRDGDHLNPEEREKFEVVRSYIWNHNDLDIDNDPKFPNEGSAVIGKAIPDDVDHDDSCGNGYVFFEDGFYDGLGVNKAYDRDTREGSVFAVNRDLTGDITSSASPQDDLVVVWYNKSQTTQVCWPDNPVRYDAQWPTDAKDFETIVIASQLGSGPLDPDTYGLVSNLVIYNQPDPEVLGYNPNEEHAAFFTAQGSTSPAIFPLRSDLNRPDTSESYTLLKYRDPLSDEWKMKVFKVVASSESYHLDAGSIVADNLNDLRYCLNSSGAVIPQLSCDAESVTYYLDAGGYLVNPDSLASCYKYSDGSISLQLSCLAADKIETYDLTDTGVLQLKTAAASNFSIDSHGVLVESDVYYRFHYNSIAGSEINPPYPLNQLTFGPCTESYINSASEQYVLRDKDEKKFSFQGDVDVKLNYFYKLQAGFFYDLDGNGNPDKTVGSCVAWLEGLDEITEGEVPVFDGVEPVETTYAISWPAQVPSLFVGETLVDAKTQTGEPVGLPNIGNQCQVDVLFDQPVVDLETGVKTYSQYSVNLIDPLTEHSSDLYDLGNPEFNLPEALKPKKDLATGRWVFTALPYHVQSRLTYDEVDKQLKLKGDYTAGVGEAFLLMNILTDRDLSIIATTLTDGDANEAAAFDAQVTVVNNKAKAERDYPATEYASLKDAELKALTAGDVHGTGYVTLAFNNHADCPAPTLLSVISVGGPLYEGDIKVIESPNPFEEKVTLKHNGDFGGNADQRAFQWMYTPADFSGVPCRPNPQENDPASCVPRDGLWYPAVLSPTAAQFTPPGESLPFYVGAADTVVEGSGQQLLADKWFAVRYNYNNVQDVDGKWPPSQLNSSDGDSDPISLWTAPQLYEGWIKRVSKKINLFDQKVKDFHATAANTVGDLISLAGQPYESPIALSDDPEYLQGLGIIEVYETLLERGNLLAEAAVLEGSDVTDINKTLLFASNRLADLYMLLGNEAYADAADPTIGFSVDGAVYGTEASSIYSFQNQTDSLLEEELDLLRGVDNPGIRPFYNRLVWNFTLGDGEVAYKENYNISDANADGEINETDAAMLFPQGHGDAWGHYLSASKKYYDLLTSENFSWVPQSEAILVAGTPVQVDYRDERKFARVASAKARNGAEIVNLTYRDHYTADPDGQWQGYKDIDPDRAWGVDGWSRRAGQGALFDWITGNAILPPVTPLVARSQTYTIENGQTVYTLPYNEPDPDNSTLSIAVTRDAVPVPEVLNFTLDFDTANQPEVTITSDVANGDVVQIVWNVPAEGIQRIDRTTVVELWDVVGSYQSIEAEVDKANAGLNPLGLVSDVVPFDIDPAAVAAGATHFEQIYDRAVQAMNNAIAVFNHANDSSQLMRRQQDTLANFQRNVENSEADYNNRLIEVFGYPYADDCGPGKTYETDYCNNGPDLYHYMYVDASELMGFEEPEVHEFEVSVETYFDVTAKGVPLAEPKQLTFHIATDSRFGIIKPPEWNSNRKAPGEIQLARSELLQLRGRFDKAIGEYGDLLFNIELQAKLINDQFGLNDEEIRILKAGQYEQQTLNSNIKSSRQFQLDSRKTAQYLRFGAKALAEGIPTAVGFSNDLGGPFRTALLVAAKVAAEIYDLKADDAIVSELGHQQAKEIAAAETSIELASDRGDFAIKQQLLQIENLVRNEATMRLEMYTLAEGLKQSANRYLGVLAKGDRLLRDRLRIRTQTAAQIQDYRYKDMTFRIFRNDALQKYRAQFDMASMYVYLAAKAYDYETTLLDSSSLAGQHFLTSIVKQRTLGQIENGQPLTGSGLADPMKRLWQNFQVLKPQLGFNNPQQETNRFSLRKEMFRITLDTGSNDTWRQALEMHRVDNLWDVPEFRRYMRPFGAEGVPEPGIVIPFSTTVTSGLNFFRWPLGGGDSYYSSSNFATKISSVGVWFSNYNAVGLAQTPRIYLVPVGEDILRTPSFDVNDIRTWKVVDQKLPVPFPIIQTEMEGNPNWIPLVDTLFDEMYQIRRHSNFRAYHDSGYINQAELQYDSRLIGRSVWNTRWLLVIPGRSLLYDAEEGLETFINGPESFFSGKRTGNGITDIKLFFETYSYSGN